MKKEKPDVAPKNTKYQMGEDPKKRNTTWGRGTRTRKSTVSYPKGRKFL